MNNNVLWETTSDGITSLIPEGFVYGYYIYPPHFFKEPDNIKHELWLIEENGRYNRNDICQFNTLEEAKEFAICKFKAIIKPFLQIV